ncbi:MAG: UbiA family prenyltransferase [Gammaproteobacteria bacterium]|nr:UbiA family prenyltransferase [Gammaproteobacteria bacterium]
MTENALKSPLCVDLDGTLIKTDLSAESLLAAIRRAPHILILLPFWLLRGKCHLKDALSRFADIDASVLPYHHGVISLVKEARAQGRHTVLVTGSHCKYAEAVASHLGLFDDHMATTPGCNLTGKTKAARLSERFGEGGFEYIANGKIDLPVWRLAGAAGTVNTPRHIVREVRSMGRPHVDIADARAPFKVWLKALRLHQWTKNALLFVPLIMAHQLFDSAAFSAVLFAFLVFGLIASATYIINDLFDLESDRHHARKRLRPFAAGTITIQAGAIGAALLLITGVALSFFLPLSFQLALALYVITTLLYSFRLKEVASLDVLILAGLYTLRVIAGALAAGLSLSFWLLAFSMFMFLCLALVKRVAELTELKRRDLPRGRVEVRGREYSTQDIPILQIMGASSGYLAVLILALYINSADVLELYKTPEALWLIDPLLLLWVTRLWVVTTRGFMDEDPIFFAIKDPETWITAIVTAMILIAATMLEF